MGRAEAVVRMAAMALQALAMGETLIAVAPGVVLGLARIPITRLRTVAIDVWARAPVRHCSSLHRPSVPTLLISLPSCERNATVLLAHHPSAIPTAIALPILVVRSSSHDDSGRMRRGLPHFVRKVLVSIAPEEASRLEEPEQRGGEDECDDPAYDASGYCSWVGFAAGTALAAGLEDGEGGRGGDAAGVVGQSEEDGRELGDGGKFFGRARGCGWWRSGGGRRRSGGRGRGGRGGGRRSGRRADGAHGARRRRQDRFDVRKEARQRLHTPLKSNQRWSAPGSCLPWTPSPLGADRGGTHRDRRGDRVERGARRARRSFAGRVRGAGGRRRAGGDEHRSACCDDLICSGRLERRISSTSSRNGDRTTHRVNGTPNRRDELCKDRIRRGDGLARRHLGCGFEGGWPERGEERGESGGEECRERSLTCPKAVRGASSTGSVEEAGR